MLFTIIPNGKGQIYENTVDSYAGYNFRLDRDSTLGGFPWLRSPYTDDNDNGDAWSILADGDFSGYYNVYKRAQAIAPAFCI